VDGILPLMLVSDMERYVSDESPPILAGMLPPRVYMEPRSNLCKFVSCLIVDGMLPVIDEADTCRYVKDVMPPMLGGMLPLSEVT
jgi:hypothetical protein